MFVDLALKVKSQKIESLDLTPPRVTPSQPDFAEARRLVANAIDKATKDAEKQSNALSAPAGVAAGTSAAAVVSASAGTEAAASQATDVSASASPEKGSEADARSICYVP